MIAEQRVAQHYGSPDRPNASWRPCAPPKGRRRRYPDALAPGDHFHGGGLAATQELALTSCSPQAGRAAPRHRLRHRRAGALDRGEILGPRDRRRSDRGVSAPPPRNSNRATGLVDRVRIINGSALALPVPDSEFDRAYSQNVIMNIADKPRSIARFFRAPCAGRVSPIANACAGPAGKPYYPQMWAKTAATSFLATPEETRRDMQEAGFGIAAFRDTTSGRLPVRPAADKELERGTAPPLGIHVLMGRDVVREAMKNSTRKPHGRPYRDDRGVIAQTRLGLVSQARLARPPHRRPAQGPERDDAAKIGGDREADAPGSCPSHRR